MAPLSRKTSYTTQVALQRCPILYMSKSGFMIPPWPATVNRLPAHHEFPFPAVDIPACGGIIPPCGAVCVPFWNAIYNRQKTGGIRSPLIIISFLLKTRQMPRVSALWLLCLQHIPSKGSCAIRYSFFFRGFLFCWFLSSFFYSFFYSFRL